MTEILKEEYQIHCGQRPPAERVPSSIIFCPDREQDLVPDVEHLQVLAPDAPILIFGLHIDLSVIRASLQAGARGFIHPRMQGTQILRALSVALKGEIVIPRDILNELARGEGSVSLGVLTHRKREILKLVAEGLFNAQIARQLYLSEDTIKQHLRATYKVLGVRNRAEAIRVFLSNS